ncbi:hypothetical protein PVK06_042407 [Gossypium arboreum]|uniref:Uncharacterized protein n=1 Tax=Gossypium arboreum TaxID=29729 RepID=A0ABR0MKL9_GOSAR|nr:hypothetical protein PVK06_042407 [Gossypium arboreum]
MDSSAQIWNTLATIYGSKSTSRLMFYRRAFHSQRKGDLLMKDFLMKVKGYSDSLASCGEIISEHEHVISIHNGLPPEYESIFTNVFSYNGSIWKLGFSPSPTPTNAWFNLFYLTSQPRSASTTTSVLSPNPQAYVAMPNTIGDNT